jgi:hypothetical protein
MNAPHDLEARLRSGLQAAAEALPPEPATPVPGPTRPPGREHRVVPSRRWAITAVATAASLAVVAGAAVVVLRGDGSEEQTRRGDVSTDESTTTTTGEPHVMQVTNGNAPGRAVVQGSTLREFGPDGQETRSIDLAALPGIRVDGTPDSASTDLNGGYVLCADVKLTEEEAQARSDGLLEGIEDAELDDIQAELSGEASGAQPPATTTTTGVPGSGQPEVTRSGQPEVTGEDFVPAQFVPYIVWVPAEGEPRKWEVPGGMCSAGSSKVIDTPDGAMVVNGGMSFTNPMGVALGGIVLATGEERDLAVPEGVGTPLPGYWSINSERTIVYVEGRGFEMFDVATAEPVTMADIDPGPPSETSLAPDGKTVAVIVGPVLGPTRAVVFDVATGEEIFSRDLDADAEGNEMSWDGRTLAIGSWYEGEGPVTVIDTATGDEHTLDAHGAVL